jgi:predicted RNase H-like HicB family nuclease
MRYIIMIRRTGTGYSADVPDLPGCVATGMTVEHARQQIAEAIEGHLDVMRESGQVAPPPSRGLEFAVDDDMGEEYCSWVDADVGEAVSFRGGAGVAARPRSKKKQR